MLQQESSDKSEVNTSALTKAELRASINQKGRVVNIGGGQTGIQFNPKLTEAEKDFILNEYDGIAEKQKDTDPFSTFQGEENTSTPSPVFLSATDLIALRDFQTGMPQGDVCTATWEKIETSEVARGGSVSLELFIKTKLSEPELNWLCSVVSEKAEKQMRKINAELTLD